MAFIFQIRYLSGASGFYSPLLWLQGSELERVDFEELEQTAAQLSSRRERQLGAVSWRPLQTLLRGSFMLSDGLTYTLPLAVFFFRFLDWWYIFGEKLAAGEPPRIQPPSPPEFTLPDPTLCPICFKHRTNPAVSVSGSYLLIQGFCFCYTCLHDYVTSHGSCPVSSQTMSPAQIRKIYEA